MRLGRSCSPAKQSNGPEGLPRGWADLARALQVNEAGRGALVGRIGTSEAARAFLIGPQLTSKSPVAGDLFIGINQTSGDSATGSFHVTIKRTAAAANARRFRRISPSSPCVAVRRRDRGDLGANPPVSPPPRLPSRVYPSLSVPHATNVVITVTTVS